MAHRPSSSRRTSSRRTSKRQRHSGSATAASATAAVAPTSASATAASATASDTAARHRRRVSLPQEARPPEPPPFDTATSPPALGGRSRHRRCLWRHRCLPWIGRHLGAHRLGHRHAADVGACPWSVIYILLAAVLPTAPSVRGASDAASASRRSTNDRRLGVGARPDWPIAFGILLLAVGGMLLVAQYVPFELGASSGRSRSSRWVSPSSSSPCDQGSAAVASSPRISWMRDPARRRRRQP